MPEIELQIHTEDDQVHRVDAPADLRVEELLKELVELFNLPAALPWSLYVKSTGRTLDVSRVLKDSGVVDGEDIFLSSRQEEPNQASCKHCGAATDPGAKFCRKCGKPLSETQPLARQPKRDIQLHLYTPAGEKHSVDIPASMLIRDLMIILVSDLALDMRNADDQEIEWALYDKEAGKTLDPAQSLEGNGVTSGHTLYIRAIEKPIVTIEVYSPNGDRHSKKVPADMSTREFITFLVKDLNLRGEVALDDKDTAKSLNPAKTLAENGVLSGHHLYIKIKKGEPIPWKWIAGVSAVALGGLLSYSAIKAWQNRPLQLSPSTVSLSAGQTQQFRAAGGGSSAPMTWSLSPEVGSISDSGLFTAPTTIRNSQPVHITAVTHATPVKSATADVSLTPDKPDQVVKTLTVSPDSVSLGAGGTQKFGATVDGQDEALAQWSLDPQVGEIAADGTYTAPHSIPARQSVTVRAARGENPGAAGSATITLKPLTIMAKSTRTTLFASERASLHATVTDSSNTSVRWTVVGPGYIAPNGVYFAPAEVPTERTVVITATSIVDPTKSATLQLLLKPTVVVTISPPSAQLISSGKQHFSAEITGTANHSAKWSIVGPGTLSEDGWYTAPASIVSAENVHITATSLAQPGKFATATVSLIPMSVSIAPASVELRAAESQAFRATVTGGEAHVVWKLTGPGRITASGLYVAPPNLKADATAEVVVYANSDPSKRATATVRLIAYHGATKGKLTWSGQIPKNTTFTITGNGSAVTVGSLEGQVWPRVPVQIALGSRDFTVVEAPGLSNNFSRLTILSEKGKKANLKIEWSVYNNE